MSTTVPAALLLLADGRFPAGGHAHSSGIEAACAAGMVTDALSLASFVHGRLHSSGCIDAGFAAAAANVRAEFAALDAALTARIVSPRLREVSRMLGRQTARAGARIWPHDRLRALRRDAPPEGPHHPIALGAVAHAAGLDGHAAALCALHHVATSAATAAVRLLGLDPYEVHAMLATLAADIDTLAARAAETAWRGIDDLPATSGPLVEILAEDHATWEVRLFAS